MKYALAVDIGASSGRHIVGWYEDGILRTEEVYRFPNGVTEQDGHLVWDMRTMREHVKTGIARRENGCTCPREAPVCTCGFVQTLRSITRKPITASEAELSANPRARSAKLRVVRKKR